MTSGYDQRRLIENSDSWRQSQSVCNKTEMTVLRRGTKMAAIRYGTDVLLKHKTKVAAIQT